MIWLALLLGIGGVSGLGAAARMAAAEARQALRIARRAVGVLAIVLALLSAIAMIPAGHAGVAVVFGRVRGRPLAEGLNLVNPFATVERISVRTETYTMSSVHHEGPVQGDDSIQALSADGLLMPLDITVAYRLAPIDVPWIYRNIGPEYVDKVIRPASRTAVREAIAGFTAQEAYATRREELARRMDELLQARLRSILSAHEDSQGRTGFLIEQVMIRNVQLPARMKEAIEEKLARDEADDRRSSRPR